METTYLPRVIDGAVEHALTISGALVIEGPRACGKTRTGLAHTRSAAFLDDPLTRDLEEVAPGHLLAGERPRLLDEWQLLPELWNQVRRAVDREPPGQFILAGSAVPSDDVTRHTGAGRFLRLQMRTLSWFEQDPERATVSLRGLFDGQTPAAHSDALSFAEVTQRLLRPGFPAWREMSPEDSALLLRGYLAETVRTDLPRLSDVRGGPAVLERLIAAVAASSASAVTNQALARDVAPVAPDLAPATVARYLDLLTRLFVVERQPAWAPKLRSRARLRTAPKLHLADPALAAVALQAPLATLREDPATVGTLFESAVYHDLAVLASGFGGQVLHYRDSNNHELDAVVLHPDGRWAAVEVKLAGARIKDAARSLSRVVDQIDAEPAFRLVITGTGPTLTLHDGTITCGLHRLMP